MHSVILIVHASALIKTACFPDISFNKMDILAVIGFVVVIRYLIYFIVPWFLDCDLYLAFHEKFGKPVSSLREKVVWITGASSGIGEYLAYVLAEAGCKLVLSARREAELERVKSSCLQKNVNLKSSDIEVVVLDICDISSHEQAFNRIITKFGKLDILVNNAGRSQRAKWEEIELAVDKDMFDLNVFSQVALSRLVAKYFFQVGAGHFVVNSSVAGITATSFSATYCATKSALSVYFNCFAIEKVDKNIPVTMIYPGAIQTNFLKEAYTEKFGQKYSEDVVKNAKHKVSVERCATLMGIAIANKLSKVWISKSLVLQLLYLDTYHPNLGQWLKNLLGPRVLQHLRDEKKMRKQEE